MINIRICLVAALVGLVSFPSFAQKETRGGADFRASKETLTRTVEDGGSGKHKAIMASDESLATHTIFRPKDLAALGEESKLPIVAWGNGACANSPWEHVNSFQRLLHTVFWSLQSAECLRRESEAPGEDQRSLPC